MTALAPAPMVGGHGYRHGIRAAAVHLPARAHRGRSRHADGRAAAPLLASRRPRRRRRSHPRARSAPSARTWSSFAMATAAPGLVHARCAHRGTTLYYGKVEARGIRCCYHGWLFDVEGHCLEQPCEPDGGRHRDLVRQPWYPVQERYGLIFAYMGPPEQEAGAAALRGPGGPRARASSSTPTTPASAAAGPPSRRATGCSTSRT